jgi:hypothetical protein
MPFPIMAALAGAQVIGGLAGYSSARKQKKYAKRRAAAAQAKADDRLRQMDTINEDLRDLREKEQSRLDKNFVPIENELARTVKAGVDSDAKARQAGDEFTNQFDASLDAARRQQSRQGVRPGSAASARLEEDASFNRARGASSEANKARRAADDTDFARKLAFSQQGQSIRQGITNQHLGEFGRQGQIRGQFLGDKAGATQQVNQARQGQIAGATAAATGAMQGFSDPFGRNSLMTNDQRKSFDVNNPDAKGQTLFDILKG